MNRSTMFRLSHASPLRPLEHIYLNNHIDPNQHLFLHTTSDLPNNKLTLPSPLLFLRFAIHPSAPSIISNNLALSSANFPQCNKKCTIFSTRPHHIAHIYHLDTYHTSPSYPRILLIPSSTQISVLLLP